MMSDGKSPPPAPSSPPAPFAATTVRLGCAGPDARIRVRECELSVTAGPEKGRSVKPKGPTLRVGKSPENDLVLTDGAVSRFHLTIEEKPEGYIVRDLGSTNGTVVNGSSTREVLLQGPSTIVLGATTLRFVPLDRELRVPAFEGTGLAGMVGVSAAMKELFAHLQLAAMTNLSVMLAGETGTGKEMAAKALHESGPRAKGPFAVFDCGATDAGLVGAALFGHKEGAYTGASGSRKGAFLSAHGGTLFLDEIGELPLDMQPKLLRALEQRQVQPLGSDQYVAVDTRIVCASHRNIDEMIVAGKFREDLYYRLAGLVLVMPPLRDRPVDIEPLARRFLSAARPDLSFSAEALDRLRSYAWPGNVRELRNVIDRAAALCRNPVILPSDLHLRVTGRSPAAAVAASLAPVADGPPAGIHTVAPPVPPGSSVAEPRSGPAPIRSIKDAEIEAIQAALKATGGNKTEAAKILGIARKTLREKLEKYGLSSPGDAPSDAD